MPKDRKGLGYHEHVAMITIAKITESLDEKENAPKDVINDEVEETVIPGKAPHEFEEGGQATLDKLQEVNF